MTPLDPLLRELAREHRTQAAPNHVERAVTSEFRRRHRRRLLPWVGLAATAASAALGYFLLTPPPAETIALQVTAPTAPPVRFTPEPSAPPPKPNRVLRAAAREITTDFFPLRMGPVLEPGEVAQVVRTRVPRRELVRFGLSATGYYASRQAPQNVRADVVFGYDGTARAIRFVHDSQ